MGDWREEYQRKLVSPDEAVRCIESGDQVFTYAQAAMPVALMEALARRKDELRDVTVYGANTMYPYGIADLYLRSIEDRVHAMISIAHPDFRKELHEQAVQNGLIRD